MKTKKADVVVGSIVCVIFFVIVYAGYALFGHRGSLSSSQISTIQYELGQKSYEAKDYTKAYIWYYRAKLNGHSRAQDELDALEGKGWFNLAKLSKEEIASSQKIAEGSKNER
jgi:hypothetical protein